MYFVKFLSHKRIDILHFWLSDVTTTSEDELKKKEYLKKIKEYSLVLTFNI